MRWNKSSEKSYTKKTVELWVCLQSLNCLLLHAFSSWLLIPEAPHLLSGWLSLKRDRGHSDLPHWLFGSPSLLLRAPWRCATVSPVARADIQSSPSLKVPCHRGPAIPSLAAGRESQLARMRPLTQGHTAGQEQELGCWHRKSACSSFPASLLPTTWPATLSTVSSIPSPGQAT